MKGDCEQNKTAYACLESGCEYAQAYEGAFFCNDPEARIGKCKKDGRECWPNSTWCSLRNVIRYQQVGSKQLHLQNRECSNFEMGTKEEQA